MAGEGRMGPRKEDEENENLGRLHVARRRWGAEEEG